MSQITTQTLKLSGCGNCLSHATHADAVWIKIVTVESKVLRPSGQKLIHYYNRIKGKIFSNKGLKVQKIKEKQ